MWWCTLTVSAESTGTLCCTVSSQLAYATHLPQNQVASWMNSDELFSALQSPQYIYSGSQGSHSFYLMRASPAIVSTDTAVCVLEKRKPRTAGPERWLPHFCLSVPFLALFCLVSPPPRPHFGLVFGDMFFLCSPHYVEQAGLQLMEMSLTLAPKC